VDFFSGTFLCGKMLAHFFLCRTKTSVKLARYVPIFLATTLFPRAPSLARNIVAKK
jgi:hypothetical protein